MTRIVLMIALAGIAVTAAIPAQAKVCYTYRHGHRVKCHTAFRPSINFHRKHPVKIVRCRTRAGHNVKC
ncbi:hypothetical protein QH494_19475 [Sphingomonas sp. AR_OL41]|uniref:hypothetical protein n=1 Tax=Sphingomonas sp. AR_OL41 TaxID=3042729 RepID=UPI00248117EF|nr:hypothetical protein [Sphingomonas sp. AR_OL41]MDH7974376.1 hypothetical protein [Sphingomonas sp. AR_OL41]